jgi:hypothetical protein
VEAAFLDRHRQVAREAVDWADFDELADERPDRQTRDEVGRAGPAGDDEHVGAELPRVGSLQHLDSAPPDELARDCDRVGDPVLAADHSTEHVVGTQAGHARGIRLLDGDAEAALQLGPAAELVEPLGRRREEQIADLLEERRTELLKEADARLCEPHLGLGRELLPNAAHRFSGRAGGDLAPVGEDDLLGSSQSEVVRDRGADGARSGYNDSCHRSSSSRSASVRPRSGARTSS